MAHGPDSFASVDSRKNEIKTTKISESLKDSLMELTMNFLLDQPLCRHSRRPDRCMRIFLQEYFEQASISRRTFITFDPDTMTDEEYVEEESASPLEFVRSKRQNVFGESFVPEVESLYVKPFFEKTEEEIDMLEKVAANVLFFRSLDEDQLEDVLNAMKKKVVRESETVITQGDEGDYFYVIEHGIFKVFKSENGEPPKHIFTYEHDGFFGELALLYNQPRAATVQAVSEGIIWALDRSTFRYLVLQSAFDKRRRYEAFMETVPVLQRLDDYDKMKLADAFTTKKFKDGELIVEKGVKPDGMYFIIQGSARVMCHDENGDEVETDVLEKGCHFGDRALMSGERYAANVYASGDTSIAFLDVGAFENILGPMLDFFASAINLSGPSPVEKTDSNVVIQTDVGNEVSEKSLPIS